MQRLHWFFVEIIGTLRCLLVFDLGWWRACLFSWPLCAVLRCRKVSGRWSGHHLYYIDDYCEWWKFLVIFWPISLWVWSSWSSRTVWWRLGCFCRGSAGTGKDEHPHGIRRTSSRHRSARRNDDTGPRFCGTFGHGSRQWRCQMRHRTSIWHTSWLPRLEFRWS